MRTSLALAAAVAVLATLATPTHGFAFYLAPNIKQCFPQQAGPDQATVSAHYLTDEPASDSTTLKATVVDPQNKEHFSQDLAMAADEHFSFQTTQAGRYNLCLLYTGPTGTRLRMEMNVVAQDDLDFRDPGIHVLEYMKPVKALYSRVELVVNEMDYLVGRQARFDDTASSTYWRVVGFTVFSGAVSVGACLWQVFTLKKFFKEKKIV